MMREAIRACVELGVGDAEAVVHDRDGTGHLGDALLEELVQAEVAREVMAARLPRA
jgi:hypothetical protein